MASSLPSFLPSLTALASFHFVMACFCVCNTSTSQPSVPSICQLPPFQLVGQLSRCAPSRSCRQAQDRSAVLGSDDTYEDRDEVAE
ncbi:hypothetical protein QBC32DRAFT_346472 [Pseudoneurospora amorphoporcata]|uniref:Secreted protein n=1 Tax=Pseudoneurospora amorphoporcata TaxID=241081 RepID=A0AAN6SEA6_9PEZI|nr:hypothetical protein QBC32DRAFT_346472 [Pseudoneurospora amorphoporcata]